MLSKQECFQGRTRQDLLCASAPIVIYALAGDPDRIGGHVDLDIFLITVGQKINADYNTHSITDFIRDIL